MVIMLAQSLSSVDCVLCLQIVMLLVLDCVQDINFIVWFLSSVI